MTLPTTIKIYNQILNKKNEEWLYKLYLEMNIHKTNALLIYNRSDSSCLINHWN